MTKLMPFLKKYLPYILLGLGVVVFVVVGVIVVKNKNKGIDEEEEVVVELPFDKRPVVSLTPSADGHWLKLKVERLDKTANMLDYELLYSLPDGRTQGVPGSVTLNGRDMFERDLLLGSESSGKFRYDEGVKNGTITIRLRDKKGKLMGKVGGGFSLFNPADGTTLTTETGDLSVTLATFPKNSHLVMMETFGVSKEPSFKSTETPFGLFASGDVEISEYTVKGVASYVYKDGWVTEKSLSGTRFFFIASSE